MADLVKEFKTLRRTKGFSQRDISKDSGVSVIAIHTWEANTRQPTLGNFNRALNQMGYELKIEPIQKNAFVQQVV
jgi:transcriptional regulator with XRE-family HTH domain